MTKGVSVAHAAIHISLKAVLFFIQNPWLQFACYSDTPLQKDKDPTKPEGGVE